MKQATRRASRYFKDKNGKEPAKSWLAKLKDLRGKARIYTRIKRAEKGNFGDHKAFDGIVELRLDEGPGYRVYCGVDDSNNLIILLVCGDKSTQKNDIKLAKIFWKEYLEE